MPFRKFLLAAALLLASAVAQPAPARALPAEVLESVVSVLPVWPGRPQGGAGGRPGVAPEGSGVVLRPGLIATAWHVVEPARRIDVRLSDGRILPARLAAKDAASDIALLRVDARLPPIAIAPAARLAQPVCAIGNSFGLGLSVTCGVVSALNVTDAGFNPVGRLRPDGCRRQSGQFRRRAGGPAGPPCRHDVGDLRLGGRHRYRREFRRFDRPAHARRRGAACRRQGRISRAGLEAGSRRARPAG